LLSAIKSEELFLAQLFIKSFERGYNCIFIMSLKAAPELVESVYSFLLENGHEATAKAFCKEAKLDEKKLKKNTSLDLMDIYSSSSSSLK
jgi:hypothetical protein